MAGRKAAFPGSEVVDAVLKFKDKVIETNVDGEKKLAVATNDVWADISIYLKNKMSRTALHTFVYKGRYNIKERLGLVSESKPFPAVSLKSNLFLESESSFDSESDHEHFSKKTFIITISSEEWEKIEPQEMVYKRTDKNRPILNSRTYSVFPKNAWTPLLAELFFDYTKLPCCLSFHRAKVYSYGINYVTVVGRCTICDSHFKGTIAEKPQRNKRVLMNCTYVGNFDHNHGRSGKKRRLIGPTKEKALMAVINNGISCESYRENEAARLMNIGDAEPSIIPSSNSLRLLKSRTLKAIRRHENILISLSLMKKEDNYMNVIHDIGSDPFFLHYHSAEQITIYRSYCHTTKHPKLVIDATGSIIKSFNKLNSEKTKTILLYEALVYDAKKSQNFTTSNMLSETHSNIEISNWLRKWLSCDVPQPKQTVCDQSLALLSAIVQSFTQFTSLGDYLIICSELLKGDIQHDSHWRPRCFIRIDVAHFIKIVSKWVPLKLISRLARDVILRTFGLLIKCQSLSKMRLLLLSLFVILSNETNGVDKEDGENTPCEEYTIILIEATSTGFIDFQKQYDDILSIANSEDEARALLEVEYERQNRGLDDIENPFKGWADEIVDESKTLLREGSGINPFYCPGLIPIIIKSMKLIPLWSGVMIPVFGYGEDISSSAAVESSFRKLKNITFKHMSLPTDAETFLETHIKSLKGSSLLRSAQSAITLKSPSHITTISIAEDNVIVEGEHHFNQEVNIENLRNESEESNSIENNEIQHVKLVEVINMNNQAWQIQSPSSSTDEFTNNNNILNISFNQSDDSDILLVDDKLLEEIDVNMNHSTDQQKDEFVNNRKMLNRSYDESDDSDILLVDDNLLEEIVNMSHPNDQQKECLARESWNRKNHKQRNSKSYLVPNPYLRHVDLNNTRRSKCLPILKNGSRFKELKSCKAANTNGKMILSNTCAFDTLASLIMVSYCDSKEYANTINNIATVQSNPFFNFISDIVKYGIKSSTYAKRADLILKNMDVNSQPLEYGVTLIECDTTIGHAINAILENFPSAIETLTCSDISCLQQRPSERSITFITFQLNGSSIFDDLQTYLNEREKNPGTLKCTEKCTLNTTTRLSKSHLFIDVLFWEDEDPDLNQRSSDAARIFQVKLCNIPQILIVSNITYKLRGVVNFRPGKSQLRTSVGHYTAYVKREMLNWELFDDLKNKPVPVKDTITVACEFLFYTI